MQRNSVLEDRSFLQHCSPTSAPPPSGNQASTNAPFAAPVLNATLTPLKNPSPSGAVTAFVTPAALAILKCLPPNASPSTAFTATLGPQTCCARLSSPCRSGSKTGASVVERSAMISVKPRAGPKAMVGGRRDPPWRLIEWTWVV